MNDIKVALLEDNVFIADLYQMVLEKGGYKVIAARNGETGIQAVLENPDLMLIYLDIMLPKRNGLDILKQLSSHDVTRKIPVVILSNLADEDIIKETVRLGARDYLKKVYITPKQLLECTGKYLADPDYTFKSYNRRFNL